MVLFLQTYIFAATIGVKRQTLFSGTPGAGDVQARGGGWHLSAGAAQPVQDVK